MHFNTDKVISSLVKKGFVLDKTHHKYYSLCLPDGKKTRIKTYVSHGSSGIDDYLIKQMSTQMKLTKEQFKNFVECPLSYEAYLDVIRNYIGEI